METVINKEAIPIEMRERKQWVITTHAKKPLKPAYGRAKTHSVGGPTIKILTPVSAKTNDPETWSTFEEAYEAICTSQNLVSDKIIYFLGYVFTKDDPYVGIDIDKLHGQTIDTKEKSREIVKLLKDNYMEKSMSGTGWHIITKGSIAKAVKKKFWEVYDTGRFFAITTTEASGEPKDSQEAIDRVIELIVTTQTPELDYLGYCLKNAEFKKLHEGKTVLFASESEADYAYCKEVARYTNNSSIIKAVFNMSNRLAGRDKSPDYLDRTIKAAIKAIEDMPKLRMTGTNQQKQQDENILKLNKDYFVVECTTKWKQPVVGHKYKEGDDDKTAFYSFEGFKKLFVNKPRPQIAEKWLTHPQRLTYKSISQIPSCKTP